MLEQHEAERLTALAKSDPPAFGCEARRLALEAYESRDWYGIYAWTKSWITSGGGARTIDAWLLYVVSALLHGQPKTAVHSVDMALRNWIELPTNRALLHWVRAAIIHRRLKDPKTAAADYAAAKEVAPSWLSERVHDDAAQCASDAAASRKRKPSVGPAPEFRAGDPGSVAEPSAESDAGSTPSVWPHLLGLLIDSE